MNTLRVSTFSLAIVLFTMGALILPVNSAFAHCKGNHKKDSECETHVHDEPGGDPSAIVYTVTLTGAFEFTQDMTLNSRENQLKSELSVTLIKPAAPMLQAVWNDVFEKCPHFFVGPTPVDVPGFTAPAGKKGWRIDKAGGVRVNFGDIPFSQEDFAGFLIPDSAWVNLALIGDIPFQDPFPPVGPIPLSHFQIYGQTESGVTPRLACDDKNFETEDLSEPIILTIQAN
jgi:hypothetical protein